MSPTSAMENYQKFKALGNEKFVAKDYKGAKGYYTQAIEAKGDEAVCYSNRAACHINLKEYYDCLSDCNKAIELDSQMYKAYFRRALALRELSRLNLALADFKKTLSLDPENDRVKEEIKKLEDIFKNNTRVDVKCYKKPEKFQSKREMQQFSFGQPSGAKQYIL